MVTWGHADFGGDSSLVEGQLVEVQHVELAWGAFAAMRSDGSVVVWGGAAWGSSHDHAREQLVDIRSLHSTSAAFDSLQTYRLSMPPAEFSLRSGLMGMFTRGCSHCGIYIYIYTYIHITVIVIVVTC